MTETSSTAARKRPVALRADFMRLAMHAPQAVFVAIAAAVLVAVACRIAVKYSFNVQEGWNPGEPQRTIWTGLKIDHKKSIPVTTLRCPKCGMLESYAKPV